ncbi:hypothetical protein GCM10009736_69590 [Actinomadura bangladeshensis]
MEAERAVRPVTLLGCNSSKAALNAITPIYGNALRDAGIRGNALSPGFCATDLNGHTGALSADEGGAHRALPVMSYRARRRHTYDGTGRGGGMT